MSAPQKNIIVSSNSPAASKERWYYMKQSQKFTQKDICSDTMKLAAKSDVDNELRQSLIDPDHGILKPGCMPQVQTATQAGCKQLLDAMSKAPSHEKSNKCLVS